MMSRADATMVGCKHSIGSRAKCACVRETQAKTVAEIRLGAVNVDRRVDGAVQ